MNKTNTLPQTIDQYISQFPADIQKRLQEFRDFVNKLLPEATETISYGMPTFDLNKKHLVHFAAFSKHIGFFPFPSGVDEFKKLSSDYKTSKGTIQFPFDKEIPWNIVEKIVKFRVQERQSEKSN